MKRVIEVGNAPDGNIVVDLRKGEPRFPLIIGQRPAGPVLDTPIHGVVWFHSYGLDTGLLQHIIGQFHTGFSDEHGVIPGAESVCYARRQEKSIELLKAITQVVYCKIKHAAEDGTGLFQIDFIVSIHHLASSPHPESA